jgi:hypothetical protein
MKKLMAALLLLVAMSSIAAAQDPFIGLYSDDVAVSCQGEAPQYATSTVYVIATLPEDIPGMTACEFSIENLPTPDLAITTFTWNTTLVIGTPGYGIALAFAPSLPGPNCLLGTIGFFGLADFGADWRMTVMPSNDSGNLVIVDLDYNEVPCEEGHFFTFNCTGTLPGGCDCTVGVATEDATWGQIKALY